MIQKSRGITSQQSAILVLIAIVAALFGGIYFLTNMSISGREFAPELFQERTFSYSRIPGTMIRMSSTSLTTATSPCGKSILSTLPTIASTTWHVAQTSSSTTDEKFGPAILLEYLESNDADGQKYWDQWSSKNPELAAVAWPILQQAALQDLYFCMPDLFDAMRRASDAAQLKKSLVSVCLTAAIQRASFKLSINRPAKPFREWANAMATEWGIEPETERLLKQIQ